MPPVSVLQVKKGSVLSHDVHSSLGGLLMQKGTRLYDREIEVLRAFMIQQIDIEDSQASKPNAAVLSLGVKTETVPYQAEAPEPIGFEQEYVQTVQFFKQVFDSVLGGLRVPMLDLRNRLRKLLAERPDPNHVLLTLKQDYPPEDYLYYHSIGVGVISGSIAKWNHFSKYDCLSIALAGSLHDIGKARISPQILNKTEKLTADQMEELKRYPLHGYQMIKPISGVDENILLGVLQHQEREDGSGYPLKLKSDNIQPFAKIIALADMFHAMCSKQNYKEAISPYLVLEQLLFDSFGKLNPTYVRSFVDGMTQFSTGTLVELSDGSIGKIVFIDKNHPTRPMVDINTQIINLSINRKLVIRKVILA
jgi:HD-GYP domain-containing protein (c-di-GMP phosphodiesterase class II)